MRNPEPIEKGQPLVRSVLSKIREIIEHLERSRLIAGTGIRLTETPSGILIGATGLSHESGTGETASSAYSGPWELSYDPAANLIRCRSGWLVRNGSGIWTGELSITPQTFLVPRMIVVESRIDTGTNNWTAPVLAFREWNSNTGSGTNASYQVPLGLWDYSTKSITQWHFSAAVHIISAYEFEV